MANVKVFVHATDADANTDKVIPMCRYALQATQKWVFLVIFESFFHHFHFRQGHMVGFCYARDIVSVYHSGACTR